MHSDHQGAHSQPQVCQLEGQKVAEFRIVGFSDITIGH